MKKSKILIVLGLAVSVMAGTTFAGKLAFSGTDTMIKNCPTTIDIYVDTQGEEIGTAGVNIVLDDSFVVNRFESNEGVYRSYTSPKILTARKGSFEGKEFLRLLGTTSSPNGYQGEGVFGTITVTPTADKVNLDFYMIPDYDGEDSNLALDTDGDITDALTEVENKVFNVVDGECNVAALGEIEIEEPEASVFAEETEAKIEETLEINEENIFDMSQETNRLKKNMMYVAIAAAALILVIIIIVVARKKRKK